MPQTNLPLDLSPLLGRDNDIADVRNTLGKYRLVTLVGSGGIGKTRLAKRVARSVLEQFRNGVWFIDLVGVSQSAGIAGAVSRSLKVQEEDQTPLEQTLARHLADQEILLVLDNCEQVLNGCARFAETLLSEAMNVKILATSREAFHIGGENVVQLSPLDTNDGVKLFQERARQIGTIFPTDEKTENTVVEIVRRLDGMPLAIELATARLTIMNPTQVLAGLDERFSLLSRGARDAMFHHKSLRACIAWSYDLMLPDEKYLAKKLCVLQGFTLDAVHSIGSDGPPTQSNVLDLLQRLVDMSMLQVDWTSKTPRYRFLESVSAFLLHELEAVNGTAAARTLHLDHFVDFAEARAPRLIFREGPDLRTEILAEFDNIENALTYAEGLADPQKMLRLLTALAAYYELSGQCRHGIRWFDRAMAKNPLPDVFLARALWGVSHVCAYGGRMDLVFPNVQRALELGQELGDTWTQARALEIIGFAQAVAQPALARESLLECIAIGHANGDDWAESHGKKMMTAVPLFSHDLEEAKQAVFDLEICSKKFESDYLLAWAKALTGYFARDSGDFEQAAAALRTSIDKSDLVGDPATGGFASVWAAALKADQGQVDVACEELQSLMSTATVTGAFLAVPEAMFALSSIAVAAGDAENALRIIGTQVTDLRSAGIPVWSEQLALVSAAAHIALKQFPQAKALLNDVEKQSTSLNNPLINGLLHSNHGQLAIAKNDFGKAEAHLHDALAIQIEAKLVPNQLRTLEAIAEILCHKGKLDDAVRTLSVVDQERAKMPLVRGVEEMKRHGFLVDRLKQEMGEAEFKDVATAMADANLEEINELITRMRGKRMRPLTGWASLTPTERRVVSLTTEGLSNPQIGERMFIARGTVKIHLSHIFEKLGVKSRTELATKVVAEKFDALF